MPPRFSSTVFLAGSTVEIISALACIKSLKITEALVFVERNISFDDKVLDLLLQTARREFPSIYFVELRFNHDVSKKPSVWRPLRGMVQRMEHASHFRKQWDDACRAELGLSLDQLATRLQTVYFTALHDYIVVFLGACRSAKRIAYPHGFDHPRRQQIREYGYLFGQRSWRTLWRTLSQQLKTIHLGGLLHGLLGCILPQYRICLPFAGVDQVVTFRSDIDYVPNQVIHITSLADTFKWLLGEQPWAGLLQGWQTADSKKAVLILLPECNRNPLWEYNRNFGASHLQLIRAVVNRTGVQKIVIKAHPRSDGSAARWLLEFLGSQEKDWVIEIMPIELSGIPVEALALTGIFQAACSLSSCSLPPGLGFGVPHYVSEEASSLFDQGWRDEPHEAFYLEGARILIQEGICEEINSPGGKRS